MSLVEEYVERFDVKFLGIHEQINRQHLVGEYGEFDGQRWKKLNSLLSRISVRRLNEKTVLSLRKTLTENNSRLRRAGADDNAEDILEWLCIAKAATVTLALCMNVLLDVSISVSEQITFYDGVLMSKRLTLFYVVQLLPGRVYRWWNDICREIGARCLELLTLNQTEGNIRIGEQDIGSRDGEIYGARRGKWDARKQLNGPERVRGKIKQGCLTGVGKIYQWTRLVWRSWKQYIRLAGRLLHVQATRRLCTWHDLLTRPYRVTRLEAIHRRKKLEKFKYINATALAVLHNLGGEYEKGFPFDITEGQKFKSINLARHTVGLLASVEVTLLTCINSDKKDYSRVNEGYKSEATGMNWDGDGDMQFDSIFEENLRENAYARYIFQQSNWNGGGDEDVNNECYDVAGVVTRDEAGKQLSRVIGQVIPAYRIFAEQLIRKMGEPTGLTKWWMRILMGSITMFSTIRFYTRESEGIVRWASETVETIMNFGFNWIITPIKKILYTIRHNENSEISMITKYSLQTDRNSLERMVMDFVVDKGESIRKVVPNIQDAQYEKSNELTSYTNYNDIRKAVREGDITPVLMVYERDLRSPLRGALLGDLVRALLILIQKTKVDVDTAVGGIDNLLRSQELVFGFVGLTPGLLICFALWKWIYSTNRLHRGSRIASSKGVFIRELRNIDRVLTQTIQLSPRQPPVSQLPENPAVPQHTQPLAPRAAPPPPPLLPPRCPGYLSFTDHGRIICSVHLLRLHVCNKNTLSSLFLASGTGWRAKYAASVQRDLLQDLNDLLNFNATLPALNAVVCRLRWAYAQWF